jgi:hypothetical protein
VSLRSARLAPLALLLVLAASGCGPGPNLEVDPLVALGTGDVGYLDLGVRDEVPTVYGPQGGYHIWGSVRATGMDWRELDLYFELLDAAGELVSNPTNMPTVANHCAGQEGCEQGMGEVVGITVFVDEPGELWARDITMAVVATDAEGRTAADERIVVPRPEAYFE